MKSKAIILLMALTTSTALFAEQYSGKKGPDFEAISSELQLDSNSREQLKSIMQNHRQQKQAARQQKQKKREMREQHRQELLTVLSYEQLFKFEQYMRQFRQHRKAKHMEK